ncbi:MAG: hypothetical protein KI790_15570 [Cyclobacteriaceae bacterium]|nr:hypothetical protein [Cyclobacteriaceae bacterium HetDA_MAG_MS6]
MLTSCENEGSAFEDSPLAGRLAGFDWEYQYGQANFELSSNSYEVEVYSTAQTEIDPCDIVSTIRGFVSVQFPSNTGTYQIPGQATLSFIQPGIANIPLTATSGFLEITAITGTRISGYTEANFDVDNAVIGGFILQVCN